LKRFSQKGWTTQELGTASSVNFSYTTVLGVVRILCNAEGQTLIRLVLLNMNFSTFDTRGGLGPPKVIIFVLGWQHIFESKNIFAPPLKNFKLILIENYTKISLDEKLQL